MAKVTFILICLIAFMLPFIVKDKVSLQSRIVEFQGFQTEFEGKKLIEIGLSERENYFLEDFPGKIGRFSDGNREIIIRWVTEATRKLHPAKDCFEAIGYKTKPLPLKIADNGNRWACFSAMNNEEKLKVCERITDKNGNEWTDISAWYWSAFSQTQNEWFAFTVAERE